MNKEEILNDYRIAHESRFASILGRREVMLGKAKFGVFGDGKEIAQLAMAKVFKKGDFRSGYYRDQTFMFAINELSITQFFSQLYAHANVKNEPSSAGRMMNSHFGTRFLDNNGNFKKLINFKNSVSDISPTASQMPRLLGLAYASKLYRNNKNLEYLKDFSFNGNEIAFGTIGDASTSEGMFFETINAAGVLQVPMTISVWDDGYGISVPKSIQTTKESISKALSGFQRTQADKGIEIFTVKGWDYKTLIETYNKAEKICRNEHIPVLIHVTELTQPQGHSTSGSHQRYKSKERLEWEQEYDCIKKFKEWILNSKISSSKELDEIEDNALQNVKTYMTKAWKDLTQEINIEKNQILNFIKNVKINDDINKVIQNSIIKLEKETLTNRYPLVEFLRKLQILLERDHTKEQLKGKINNLISKFHNLYNSNLYSTSKESALNVKYIGPEYKEKTKLEGREIIKLCFDDILKRDLRTFFIGEDIGNIGGVNQGLAGLQKKYGDLRVTDTGIRECTIVGQGIGAAMRGLRPIVEIQYLDYLNYALQIISDDLATLRYRTKNGQKAPLIIRTRGHRLEGIWHSGSYFSSIINSVRGIYVITPRNFVQAAGFYNTMLKSDDSAIIIERLNAYRLKEIVPSNIKEITIPLGYPEILKEGSDITLVTYGAMCDIVLQAAYQLEEHMISCEVIDVQTLLPFDINHNILKSLQKTNRIAFIDEDVPGGTTAYMLQKVIEEQDGYKYLDEKPLTITSQENRPAYGDDGNYFCKPNLEVIFSKINGIVNLK
ncbi:MAG: transketolase [Bacteroidetes bacterium]|nr:transketolase [Bacteroidota bacterium]